MISRWRASKRRWLLVSALFFLLAAVLGLGLFWRARHGVYDLVITGGRVFDGERFLSRGTRVAVRGRKIAAVGLLYGVRSHRWIDTEGQIVTPGFIDVHTHVERQVLPGRGFWASSFARQGVTTIITGNCGSSRLDLRGLFHQLESGGTQINVASLIGHNDVREKVMGKERSAEKATPDDIAEMARLVREGMEAGALGFSTGLQYAPGVYASEDEVVGLAKVAEEYGGIYATHMRDEGVAGKQALEEAIRISRAAGIHLHLSHFKIAARKQWGSSAERMRMMEQARLAGIPVTLDVYAYLASSTSTEILLPKEYRGKQVDWRSIIADAGRKAKLFVEMQAMLDREGFRDYTYARIASFGTGKYDGMNIPQAAAALGFSSERVEESVPVEAVSHKHTKPGSGKPKKSKTKKPPTAPAANASVGLRPELRPQMEAILYFVTRGHAQMLYFDMNEQDMESFMKDSHTCFGTDSGVRYEGMDKGHPRGTGNFPKVLADYVRSNRTLSMEEALRKMTSLPAAIFGLAGRGQLEVGDAADIVIFDPETIEAVSDYGHAVDWPRGFSLVMVNGKAVYENGAITRVRPGMALRGPGKIGTKRATYHKVGTSLKQRIMELF